MIFALLRRLLLTFINLFLLSLISYSIFMRDPSNQSFAESNFYSGYLHYVKNLLQGDLGITYNGGDSLNIVIATVLPPTLELCLVVIFLACLFGIPLGVFAAFQHHKLLGKLINALSSLGIAVPVFWVAPILLYLAAVYHWQIAAVGQYNTLYEIKAVTGFTLIDMWLLETPDQTKIIQNVLQHLALPALVLMISPTMELTRLVQQRTQWLLNQNYVKFSITKGWSHFMILRRYILRNTIPLIIQQIPRLLTFVLALSMLVENTLAWPGIGRWLILSVAQQDYNAIAATVIIIGLLIITVNILAEVCILLLDPLGIKGWANDV